MNIKTKLKIKLLSSGFTEEELDIILNSMYDVIEVEKDEFKNLVEQKLLIIEKKADDIHRNFPNLKRTLDTQEQVREYDYIEDKIDSLINITRKLIKSLYL